MEMILLSTHNICFGWEIRKLFFWSALLTKGLMSTVWMEQNCQSHDREMAVWTNNLGLDRVVLVVCKKTSTVLCLQRNKMQLELSTYCTRIYIILGPKFNKDVCWMSTSEQMWMEQNCHSHIKDISMWTITGLDRVVLVVCINTSTILCLQRNKMQLEFY